MNEPSVTIQTSFAKTRTVVQVGILGVVAFVGGYLMLYSDRHNDARYVAIASYAKDRENDERFRGQADNVVSRRLDQQDVKLKEISDDVKTLLRESRK